MQPITRPRIHSSLAIAAGGSLVAAFVAACAGDATRPSSNVPAQLSFAATTSPAAAGDLAPAAAITAGTHTLDLTSIGLTITRAELKRAATDVCTGDDEDEDANDDHPHNNGNNGNNGNHDGCGELKVGPTTLAIAVNGNAASIPTNSIPAGSYRELELRLSQVEIKGTFDGTAFDVTVPFSTRAEIEFDPPLVVDEGTPANLTVNLPLATWFTNPDGSLVDPNQLTTNPTLLAQVKARILKSLRAIEDRDHDGRDDHGRDRHGDHGGNSGQGGNSGPG
jgi:hypothetical protein